MNIYQRIVLILGAIVLVLAIWTAPRITYSTRTGYISIPYSFLRKDKTGLLKLARVDFQAAIVRATGVVGVTVLIFFALRSKDKKE